MEAYIKTFLKKFVASLYLSGVKSIPFSGDGFQNGIESMQAALKASLSNQEYEMISDMFIKSPVQETYNKVRDLLMELNDDIVNVIRTDSLYCVSVDIQMNNYYAYKLMRDSSVCGIDSDKITEAADRFCEAAGVMAATDIRF